MHYYKTSLKRKEEKKSFYIGIYWFCPQKKKSKGQLGVCIPDQIDTKLLLVCVVYNIIYNSSNTKLFCQWGITQIDAACDYHTKNSYDSRHSHTINCDQSIAIKVIMFGPILF